MISSNHDYRGLTASIWDLSRGDTSTWSERFFYLDIVRRFGQPALDVGCGTGRIVLDFLAQGIDIDGVDNSPDMLVICRKKAVALNLAPNLYEQSMENLDLPRKYRTILVPSSTFTLITDLETAKRTLRRFVAHLLPGGAFVSPMSMGWREGDPLDSGWKQSSEKVRSEDGAVLRIRDREWFEPQKQFSHSEQIIELELDGRTMDRQHIVRSPECRCYTPQQAAAMYREAGLSRVEVFKAFTNQPVGPEDRLFCAIGVNE